jgi:hypothetical protein
MDALIFSNAGILQVHVLPDDFSPGGTPRLHGRQDACRYDHPRVCHAPQKLLYSADE